MGRRRQKNELGGELYVLLAIVLLGIWAVMTVLKTVSILVLLAIMAGVAAIAERVLIAPCDTRIEGVPRIEDVIHFESVVALPFDGRRRDEGVCGCIQSIANGIVSVVAKAVMVAYLQKRVAGTEDSANYMAKAWIGARPPQFGYE